MRPGPLRQLAGAVGLVALTPTAVLLGHGAITPVGAAARAVVTLLGVVVVGRVTAWWLETTAGAMERRSAQSAPDAASPGRRATDQPGERSSQADSPANSEA